MEINVQKDLRTGESRVISTSTVSTQELQHRGIKVYDDGRKSVYALRSDAVQPGANGVDELSPMEVEELLRQATEKKMKKQPQECGEPLLNMNFGRSPSPGRSLAHQGPNGYVIEPYSVDMAAWPELVYCDSGVNYPGQDVQPPAHLFHHYSDGQAEYYSGNDYSHELYQRDLRPHSQGPFYNPQGTLHVDSDLNGRPPSAYSNESRISVLNARPSDEPVTMIFMGYQTADESSNSYEGSVRAELVVIGDGEEDRTQQNRNTNNASQRHLQASQGLPGSQKTKKTKGKPKRCCMLM